MFEEFKRFGMLQQTSDTDQALALCLDSIRDPGAKARCVSARDRYLAGRVDVTL